MGKTVKGILKTVFIDGMGAMAQGLFASLLIGTIFNTIGTYTGLEIFTKINSYAAAATGMAIGVAIALSLKADPLVIFSAATVGYVHMFRLIEDERSRNITVYAVLIGLFLYWIYSIYAGGIGNFQWIFNNL